MGSEKDHLLVLSLKTTLTSWNPDHPLPRITTFGLLGLVVWVETALEEEIWVNTVRILCETSGVGKKGGIV